MTPKDWILVFISIPIIIASAISIMILSYLIVPVFTVGFVGIIAYALVKASKEV